jgi:hypothetical protein
MVTPKQKVKIKIKVDSTIVIGHIHLEIGGRVSDYITSKVDNFIPVTEAKAYSLENGTKKNVDVNGKYDVVFINVKNIEMMTVEGIEQTAGDYDEH